MNIQKKLITFVTGGDPDFNTSNKIIENLVKNGADIIEIGMPFSDPMADGPVIQLSSNRAIKKNTDFFSSVRKKKCRCCIGYKKKVLMLHRLKKMLIFSSARKKMPIFSSARTKKCRFFQRGGILI